MTTFFHVARPYYPVSSLVLQMIPECESHAKHLEEQMVTFSPLEAQMVKFSHLEEMERKVQQLEQELQWALVIEIEKVIYHLLSYWVDTHSLL